MRFFSSPSIGLYAAGLVVASGCSLIASPDESLLDGSGGDAQSSSVSGLPSANSSSASTTTGSSNPTSSTSTGGEQGGGGSGPSSSSASQGGGGSTSDGGGGSTSDGGGGSTSDGGGGSTSQGGGGAGGGTGGGPDCTIDPETECPPTGNECILPICDGGSCSTENADPGTRLSVDLSPGNCKADICDGDGGFDEEDDDDDIAVDNPLDCIIPGCAGGDPDPTNVDNGDACGDPDLDLECLDGVCVGCVTAADCGTPATCKVFTCSVAGECIEGDLDDGTPVPDADENCQRVECQSGAPQIVADPADPEDDANDCTIDDCNGTTPRHSAEDGGTACDLLGNDDGFCNGTTDDDACSECFDDIDCGVTDICQTNTCNAGFTCDATVFVQPGTPAGSQTPGDCRQNECNGSGTPVPNVVLDSDTPANVANDCLTPRCTNGVSDPITLPPGTACSVPSGLECDNAGTCVPFFCTSDTDCNGSDTFCNDFSCTIATGVCTGAPRNNGLVDTDVVDNPNDCQDAICNGGTSSLQAADGETPLADANSCTQEICSGGVPHPPVAPNGACIGGGGFCTGATPPVCVECTLDVQCLSGSCDEIDNTCDATCSDTILNQNETDIDCGGVCLNTCNDGDDCLIDADCVNDFCRPDTDVCATPTCSDGFQNQDETDLNCGGICGANCALGDSCLDDGDCASGECNTTNNTCSLAAAATLLSENFDALPDVASTLTNFETLLTGWQLTAENAATRASSGTDNAGAVYSFGLVAGERALGSLGSGSNDFAHFGVCATNSTGAILTNVNVAYNGEQWRNGGVAGAFSLTFAFTRFATITGDLNGGIATAPTGNHATGWENVTGLSFTSPVTGSPAAAVDGNVAGRTAISAQLPALTLANGATFCVRWSDIDDAGSDHGLGIDDLVITGL